MPLNMADAIPSFRKKFFLAIVVPSYFAFYPNYADKDTYIVLDNTVKLFNKLNRKTIFAGVEDEKTAQVIETLKPNYAQGFYYSRPLDLNDLIIFLKKHNEEVEKTIE